MDRNNNSSSDLSRLIKQVINNPQIIENKKREEDFFKKTDQYVPDYDYDPMTGGVVQAEFKEKRIGGDSYIKGIDKIKEFNESSFIRRSKNRR